MHQAGKLENIKQEAKRMDIDIMGLAEVSCLNSGRVISDDYTLIYSRDKKEHKHGAGVLLNKTIARSVIGFLALSDRVLLVKLLSKPFNLSIVQVYAPTSARSEEEIEKFYSDLDDAHKACGSQDMVIVMGDMNAKVGREQDPLREVVGRFGLGQRNERGDLWVEWCVTHQQVIMNTWFQHHKRHLYTWKSPGDGVRNQIDYITINKRFRNSIQQVRSYPGADCGSDHVPIVATMKVKFRKLQVRKPVKKLQMDLLRSNRDYRYSKFQNALTESAQQVLPAVKATSKQKWMTDVILQKMDQRRQAKGNTALYNLLDKEIRQECRDAKEKMLMEQCQLIEELDATHKTNLMHSQIRLATGKRQGSGTATCIEAKDGTIIMEKEDILLRWHEYMVNYIMIIEVICL